MTSKPSDLPDFGAPPVAEVVFGVRFTTAEPLRVFHIGLYRELIKADFPEFQEQPPLPAREEPRVEFVQGPPPLSRCWFLDATGTRLVQLQTDRFIHNWRKMTGEERYPRYDAIRDEFLARWGQFRSFAEAQGMGTLTPLALELSYVNHVVKGTCWSRSGETGRIFGFLSDRLDSLVPGELDSITCGLRYELPGSDRHLHVSLSPAIRATDREELMRFDLSVRGGVAALDGPSFAAWFDAAHEVIVRGFASLTTDKAHEAWRRVR